MCLWIINYQPGEIVHQSIVQLFGFDNNYHDQIRINNKYNWPIIQGLFKIFVQLHQGQNTIYLSTNMSDLAFLLLYQPLSTITIPLRLVYVTLSNQFDNDIEQIYISIAEFCRNWELPHCSQQQKAHGSYL